MISFIVIGKNEGWRLEKCLSAVRRRAEAELAQPWEVIYVDSQSTDGSVELARQYANKVFLITGECNPAIGRNIGAKEATGDILFFLDGDMEMREGVLTSILYKGILKYPIMEGVDYNILYDNEWHLKNESPRTAFVDGLEWFENSPSGGMFVIEREIWEKVGGMDNRFRRCEDSDFGFRAYKAGYKTRRIGQLWVNHYTRYYALRNEPLTVEKFLALLTRKYWLKGFAFKTLFIWNYSCYLLAICIIMFIVTFNGYVFFPYLLILAYRTKRVIQHTPAHLNWVSTAYKRFMKDVLLIYFFCTFFPYMPVVSYNRVK